MEGLEKDHPYSESSQQHPPAREEYTVPGAITHRLRDRELLRKRKAEAQEKDTLQWWYLSGDMTFPTHLLAKHLTLESKVRAKGQRGAEELGEEEADSRVQSQCLSLKCKRRRRRSPQRKHRHLQRTMRRSLPCLWLKSHLVGLSRRWWRAPKLRILCIQQSMGKNQSQKKQDHQRL
nr:hemogen isoform X3 [Chelonoidis abingdonii]